MDLNAFSEILEKNKLCRFKQLAETMFGRPIDFKSYFAQIGYFVVEPSYGFVDLGNGRREPTGIARINVLLRTHGHNATPRDHDNLFAIWDMPKVQRFNRILNGLSLEGKIEFAQLGLAFQVRYSNHAASRTDPVNVGDFSLVLFGFIEGGSRLIIMCGYGSNSRPSSIIVHWRIFKILGLLDGMLEPYVRYSLQNRGLVSLNRLHDLMNIHSTVAQEEFDSVVGPELRIYEEPDLQI